MSIKGTTVTTVFYPVQLTEETRQLYGSLRLTDTEVQSIELPNASRGHNAVLKNAD